MASASAGPRVIVDRARIGGLRVQGRSWRDIAREVGTNTASARRAFLECDKNLSESEVGSLYRSSAD
jgi:hypothetical protein